LICRPWRAASAGSSVRVWSGQAIDTAERQVRRGLLTLSEHVVHVRERRHRPSHARGRLRSAV
jgi:hypothetical protein